MKYLTLSNGLSVLFHQMQNTHSVTVGLYVKAGSGYETSEYNGITHLLEHLHFRKLGKYSQEELYYKMESMGSTLRAATYCNFLKFTMKVVPEKIEECIDIFQELIVTKEWMDEEIEQEKQVVINQILEKGNYITIDREVRKNIFKDHGLANEIMGNIQTVNNIRKTDLEKYKKEMFSSSNMMVCITGNFTESKREKILKRLEALEILETANKKTLFAPDCFCTRKPDIYFRFVQDNNPLDVNLSFDMLYNEESKDLLTIMNCILGEGVGSKLQRRIREEQCYSSDIASFIEWYPKFAVLHISFTVEKRAFLNCLRDIIIVLKSLKTTICQRDLDVTLPFYTTNQVFYEDDTEEMNFQLAYNEFVLGMTYESNGLKNNCETILALQDMAQKVFRKNNMSIVVVGNTRNITKKSIKELAELL